MALRLVLTLLALRIATSTSLPAPAPGHSLDAPKVDAEVPDASANGRKLDAVSDAEDEPIALLIGKDVKRVMRRKGSDGKAKVSRRREQHKDLESHLLESHEWSPQDSELERILDPVSLEDPEDIELKKAIAQLLKEVADREEKRRHKQHHDLNRGNSKASDEKVPHEDVNISTEHEHQELKTSQDNLSDDVENHDEIDDHVDSAIDKIEDSNDTEFRSSSIDVDEDFKLSDEDLESTESDLDDLDSRISHEPRIAPKKEELLKHDDHHDEKHTVHHDNDGDLKHKDNHHNQHRHVSKETIEKETDDENHHVNIDNITLEQSLDSISGDKSEELEHGVDSEEEAKPKNGNNRKHHTYERSSYQQHNIDGEISHENEKILKNKAQEDDQSHQDHGNDIKTEQKDNKIHKDSQNENSYEDISDLENHDEENDDDESDQTEELEDYQDSNSRLYSFENYDILNEDSDENQHPKDQAQKTSSRHSDELSSEDDNDFTISHRSHDDSKEETENDSKDDLSSKNPTNEAVKVIVDHHNDSIEIVSHRLPKRRRSRKNDRIRKSYRRANKNGPTKQYTLSFYLKK